MLYHSHYIYSNNDKYLVIATPNGTIDLLFIPSQKIIKTYNLQDSTNSTCLTNFEDGFLSGNSKGYIKFFSSQNFLNSYFDCINKTWYPNKNIQFNSYTNMDSCSYRWDFGDGTSSTKQNPVHRYLDTGLYSVKLKVSKGSKTDSTVKINYIHIIPDLKADFTIDKTSGDPPISVKFTDKSTGYIKSWKWISNDGWKDSVKNPKHDFYCYGNYPVTLIVTDGFTSDTAFKKDLISVNLAPIRDSLFLREKVFSEFSDTITALKGFELNSGRFLMELRSNKISNIYCFDEDINQIWQLMRYPAKFHSLIQKSADNLYYVCGSANQSDSTNYYIKNITDNGFLTNMQALKIDSSILAMDFCTAQNGIYSYNYYQSRGGYRLHFDKALLNDTSTWKSEITCQTYGTDNYFSVKAAFNQADMIFFSDNLYYNSQYNAAQIGALSLSTSTANIFFNNQLNRNSKVNFIEAINPSAFAFDQFGNQLFIVNKYDVKKNTYTLKQLSFNNSRLTSITKITDKHFVIAGSLNGQCWFAVLDTAGNKLEEHTLDYRWGSFESVSLNKDNSLTFFGRIKKNLSTTYKSMDKINIMALKADSMPEYVFILRSKPLNYKNDTISWVQDLKPLAEVYPNPANEEINFTLPSNNETRLLIYNSLGQQIYRQNISSEKLSLEVSQYSQGIYYYRISSGDISKTGSFVILR
ncbi:MAG: PKD domain-containing protein [Candidatus Kapabacteria bacterium]|nr:PKD domain-containing protein [Candidatus Kapabacteria bacterium]